MAVITPAVADQVETVDGFEGRFTERDGAMATLDHNLPAATGQAGASLASFVDAAGHDLHLSAAAAEAIGQGIADPEAGLDIDGETHDDGAPDLGADER